MVVLVSLTGHSLHWEPYRRMPFGTASRIPVSTAAPGYLCLNISNKASLSEMGPGWRSG
jgi:hypothetical protein